MTITIDRDKALDLLKQAVAQRGEDFTYEMPEPDEGTCLYWHEAEAGPGCIVGLALSIAGVPNDVLAAFDRNEPGDEGGSSIYSLANRGNLSENGIEVTPSALAVFGCTQRAQDQGATWGTAVEYGEKEKEF